MVHTQKLFITLTHLSLYCTEGSSPADDVVKKSHSDDKKSKSHHHHHSSSNKDKSGSSSKSDNKHHKHKSHHHSHNGEKESKSSSKKRTHEDAIEQDSKEYEAKKLKTEAVKKEKSKEQKSSSNGHHKSSSSKKKMEREKSQEFDESQGVNFADILASLDPPTTSSKQKKDNLADKIVKVKSSERNSGSSNKPSKSSTKSSSSSSTSNKVDKSTSHPKPSTSGEPRKSIQTLTQPPKLLTEKPKLDIMSDIVNEIPNDVSIPEYRPLPLNSVMKDYINSNVLGSNSSEIRQMKFIAESKILAESFSSKANRTRVYSGNAKSRAEIPKLFDMCIRVLQENIDYLECTGGVPFDLLKPVLERAKPDQLATIEYYNPYLLEESDVLWRPHCQRKWRNKQPQEMETWREMFERCTREDEEKLNLLTKHIRHKSEVTSSGIQKTKMAYVDSMVKPPRGVARKQEQFGTSRKLVASATARTEGLKNLAPNLVSAGDVRLRVQAGLRDDAQHGEKIL